MRSPRLRSLQLAGLGIAVVVAALGLMTSASARTLDPAAVASDRATPQPPASPTLTPAPSSTQSAAAMGTTPAATDTATTPPARPTVTETPAPSRPPSDTENSGGLPSRVHTFPSRDAPSTARNLGAATSAPAMSGSACASGQLCYFGGSLMTTSKTVAIYWLGPGCHFETACSGTTAPNSTDTSYENIVNSYFQKVGNPGTPLYSVLTQYSTGGQTIQNSSTFDGSCVDTTPYASVGGGHAGTSTDPLLDADLEAEVTNALSICTWSGNVPTIDGTTEFFIFTGLDVESCFDASHGDCSATDTNGNADYCAYHGSFGNVIYANMPSMSSHCNAEGASGIASPNGDSFADNVINVTSHEHFESVSDPNPCSGWCDSGGNEIGDKCAWTFGPSVSGGGDVNLNGRNYLVQQEWSNANSGCVMALSSSQTPCTNLTLSANPSLATVTVGGSVTFTAGATCGGTPVFQWFLGTVHGSNIAWQQVQAYSTAKTYAWDTTGLAPGQYYVGPWVENQGGPSGGFDETAALLLTVQAPPGMPRGVTAIAGNGGVTVTWSAPVSNGGSPITGYTVTGSPGGSAVVSGTTLMATVPGLTNGTAYTFTVHATSAIGNSVESAPSNAVTPAPTVPGAPADVRAGAGNAQATVRWQAPGSDGGNAITGYTVTPFIGSAAQTPVVFSGTETTQTITGLTNGTAYTFTVKARNGAGTGLPSTPSNAVIPTASLLLSGTVSGTGSYTIAASVGGIPCPGASVVTTGSFSGLSLGSSCGTAGQAVTLQVNGGAAGLTTAGAATCLAFAPGTLVLGLTVTPGGTPNTSCGTAAVPGAPGAVRAGASDAKATVTWTAPPSNGGSAITGYTVTPFIGSVAQTAVVVNGTATTQTITGLSNGTAYTFTVRATNAAGTGLPSTASNAVTPSAGTGP